MPHQCVRCNKLYPDGSKELLRGCSSCGGKFFFFIKKDVIETDSSPIKLTQKEKQEIEKDIRDIIGKEADETKPVILDLESIRVLKPGSYEIDVVKLLKNKMLIYRLEDGKYVIDLNSTLK